MARTDTCEPLALPCSDTLLAAVPQTDTEPQAPVTPGAGAHVLGLRGCAAGLGGAAGLLLAGLLAAVPTVARAASGPFGGVGLGAARAVRVAAETAGAAGAAAGVAAGTGAGGCAGSSGLVARGFLGLYSTLTSVAMPGGSTAVRSAGDGVTGQCGAAARGMRKVRVW